MFTDGSCLNNGNAGAAAGIGIAVGPVGPGEDQWSILIDDTIDPENAKRVNARSGSIPAGMKPSPGPSRLIRTML